MTSATSAMSPYEEAAWQDILRWREQRAASLRSRKRGAALARTWGRMPGSTALSTAVLRSVEGMHGLVTDAAVSSLSVRRVQRAYAAYGVDLGSGEGLHQLRQLDLSAIDGATPTLGTRYAMALAGEGAVTGALAGVGASAAAVGGAAGAGVGAVPGATATAGLLAADIAAVLGGSTRAVGHYATYHGYDPREPWERPFLLGVMGAAVANDQATKLTALAELRRLGAALAVRGAADQAGSDVLARLLRRLLGAFGERLTQRKLASVVPVAGAVVGAGLNYSYVRDVADCARWLYRERFLIDKYELHRELAATAEPVAELEALAGRPDGVPQVPPPPPQGRRRSFGRSAGAA